MRRHPLCQHRDLLMNDQTNKFHALKDHLDIREEEPNLVLELYQS
jgi:hypothetical protein